MASLSGAVVAGRDDEQRARRRRDGVVLRAREAVAAQRGVDHPRAVARGVGVGGEDVGDVAAAVVAEHAQRHQARGPAHAGHSAGVVAACRDGARDVGAVAVAVLGLRVLVDEVPAVHVVDAPVAVVVEPVGLAPATRLAGVRPQVGAEVGMGGVDPGVDHRDGHLRRAGGDVPGLGSADGRQSPLIGQQRVVRRGGLVQDVVGLGVEHAVHALEVGDRGADADPRLGVDELEPPHGEHRVALDVGAGAHVGPLRGRSIRRRSARGRASPAASQARSARRAQPHSRRRARRAAAHRTRRSIFPSATSRSGVARASQRRT